MLHTCVINGQNMYEFLPIFMNLYKEIATANAKQKIEFILQTHYSRGAAVQKKELIALLKEKLPGLRIPIYTKNSPEPVDFARKRAYVSEIRRTVKTGAPGAKPLTHKLRFA